MANVTLENRPPLKNAFDMLSNKTKNPYVVYRIVSAGSSSSGRTVQNNNGKLQLRRENTYPGTAESLKKYPSVRFQAKSKPPNISKVGTDQGIRVLRLRSEMKCFPLLQRNLNFAKDIEKMCREAIAYVNVPNSPGIFDQQELQLYIATDSVSEDFSQEVSAIMGDHTYSNKTDVTEKCFSGDFKSVTLDQDCSCLILFLHKEGTNITVHESANVLYVPSPSIDVDVSEQSQSVRVFREDTESPKSIRRKLTHILGEDLFTYAEEVQRRLGVYEKTIKSPNHDQKTMLRNTKEAVNVLLTRRVPQDCDISADGGSTKYEIPDDIDSALNGMKDSGVMAFGLFVDRFVVFIDETGTDQVQQDTTKEIKKLCNEQSNFKLPVDVVTVSQNFLTDTGLEQGSKLESRTQWGTVGMVTGATKEADGPTTSNSGRETHKNIVVVITAGHLFTPNEDAFFVNKNDERMKFGKCLKSLHRTGDTATMSDGIAVIELDENMRTSEDFDVKFRNESGESCDCFVFNGTLASGNVMYKKGAATGMSEGVVVSPDFRLVDPVDTQKAYLIKGREDRAFSTSGDSGSIVFTSDVHDEECRTVNLVSVVTKMMTEDAARGLGIDETLSYTVRLDKCLKKLSELHGVTVKMPEK